MALSTRFQAASPAFRDRRPFSLRSCAMAMQTNGSQGNGAGNGALPGGGDGDYRFPASAKVYVPGGLHPDVRVPMREITLSSTRGHNGGPAEEIRTLRV